MYGVLHSLAVSVLCCGALCSAAALLWLLWPIQLQSRGSRIDRASLDLLHRALLSPLSTAQHITAPLAHVVLSILCCRRRVVVGGGRSAGRIGRAVQVRRQRSGSHSQGETVGSEVSAKQHAQRRGNEDTERTKQPAERVKGSAATGASDSLPLCALVSSFPCLLSLLLHSCLPFFPLSFVCAVPRALRTARCLRWPR